MLFTHHASFYNLRYISTEFTSVIEDTLCSTLENRASAAYSLYLLIQPSSAHPSFKAHHSLARHALYLSLLFLYLISLFSVVMVSPCAFLLVYRCLCTLSYLGGHLLAFMSPSNSPTYWLNFDLFDNSVFNGVVLWTQVLE